MLHASRFARLLSLLVFTSPAIPGTCQLAPSLTRSTPDGSVILPVKTGILGQKDEGALVELKAHRAAVGGIPWVGMMGRGKITYGSDSSTSYDATLSNIYQDGFRLDAAAQSGETSIRIYRDFGKVQAVDASISTIPLETALSGLFPFEMARFDPTSEALSSMSMIDHGLTMIGSTSLHRITLERPSLDPTSRVTVTTATHVIDLYFDPATHLLAKSAVYDTVARSRNIPFLFVVSYADYRNVGNVLVPFRYSETMEGQPYRTVQLSTVALTPPLTVQDFQF